MQLAKVDVERFYNIWFALLHYVNQQRKLVGDFPAKWNNVSVSPALAVPLRDALWKDDTLREAFIAENPSNLSVDDLALVKSWQHRVVGAFFIFRHLKKYSIFLTEADERGYGVLGLISSFEEVVGPHMPIYVEAVLLPYEDCIIYDGLLVPYSIYFGSGIRASLANNYRNIQERGGIITKLPYDDNPNLLSDVRASNKKVLAAFQKALGASGLSPKMILEHSNNLNHYAVEFLLKQSPPGKLLDISMKTLEAYQKIHPTLNWVSFKRFVWFLRDTNRIDWDAAENLLDSFKRQ